MYSLKGLLGGEHHPRLPEAIDRIQENSRHYFQRPGSPVRARSDAHVAHRRRRPDQFVEDRRAARPLATSTPASSRPATIRTTSGFMRRADQRSMGAWVQIRSDKPTRWFRSRNINFNQNASWNSSGDRLVERPEHQRARDAHEQLELRRRLQRSVHGIDDRVTRGGPAAIVEGFKGSAGITSTSDNRRAVSFNYNGGSGTEPSRIGCLDVSPGLTFRPMSALQSRRRSSTTAT